MTHHEFILAGTGGQGLILAGILLAEAAMLDGRNVVQTQSYGIASRGGLSLAEVIIDDDEFIFKHHDFKLDDDDHDGHDVMPLVKVYGEFFREDV